MEISKIEKVDISTIRVGRGRRSDLTTKLLGMNVGEAFTVTGVEREAISSRMSHLRREGRSFVTNRVGTMQFRVVRVA